MKQLKLRWAEQQEWPQFLKWLAESPGNDFDSGILNYPTLQVLCAHNGKAVAYLPVHKSLVLESVARSPEADNLELAQALRDMVKGAELFASGNQLREIYFIVSDERVAKIAKDHGFEEKRVMRLKL